MPAIETAKSLIPALCIGAALVLSCPGPSAPLQRAGVSADGADRVGIGPS
jgi:hypothetical protein